MVAHSFQNSSFIENRYRTGLYLLELVIFLEVMLEWDFGPFPTSIGISFLGMECICALPLTKRIIARTDSVKGGEREREAGCVWLCVIAVLWWGSALSEIMCGTVRLEKGGRKSVGVRGQRACSDKGSLPISPFPFPTGSDVMQSNDARHPPQSRHRCSLHLAECKLWDQFFLGSKHGCSVFSHIPMNIQCWSAHENIEVQHWRGRNR